MYYFNTAVREDRMPGGRHRHKSQTQDSKEKNGKKRRPSKDVTCSPSPSSLSGDSSPSFNDDVDVIGMLSKYFMCMM